MPLTSGPSVHEPTTNPVSEYAVERAGPDEPWDRLETFAEWQDARSYLATVVEARAQPFVRVDRIAGSYLDPERDIRVQVRVRRCD